MCIKLKIHMSGMTVVVLTSSWSRDDNRLEEFLTIHMMFTPLRLVLFSQYLISPSIIVVNTLASRRDKSFVVHLLEPAIKGCLKGTLCNSESASTNKGDFYFLQAFPIPLIL